MQTINKSDEIRSRIEPGLKSASTEVLAQLGLSMSDAIRLFLRQVVVVGGLPFEVRRPNPVTLAAMAEADEMCNGRGQGFGSLTELFNALDQKDSPP